MKSGFYRLWDKARDPKLLKKRDKTKNKCTNYTCFKINCPGECSLVLQTYPGKAGKTEV